MSQRFENTGKVVNDYYEQGHTLGATILSDRMRLKMLLFMLWMRLKMRLFFKNLQLFVSNRVSFIHQF